MRPLAAIALRQPPTGCVRHGNRGSQDAALNDRNRPCAAKLTGSIGRRGNPYDNAKQATFMKALEVEGVRPLEFETAEDVAEELPPFIGTYNVRRLNSSLRYLGPEQYEARHARPPVNEVG